MRDTVKDRLSSQSAGGLFSKHYRRKVKTLIYRTFEIFLSQLASSRFLRKKYIFYLLKLILTPQKLSGNVTALPSGEDGSSHPSLRQEGEVLLQAGREDGDRVIHEEHLRLRHLHKSDHSSLISTGIKQQSACIVALQCMTGRTGQWGWT